MTECDNRGTRMRLMPFTSARRILFTVVFATGVTLSLAGCGYHTAGAATHIPAGVRSLAVPVFATHAEAYHTEMALTQAVVRELNTRTRYRIVTSDTADADAVLRGTVLTQTSVPLTYDATSGETSSYLLTITVKVVLSARDGRVLYRNDAYSYREQYQSTQDISSSIREDPAAVNRLSQDFAQALVGDMLESF
jgi:outer membrane lipopolysaccharide assembly protein LptE/RlpB